MRARTLISVGASRTQAGVGEGLHVQEFQNNSKNQHCNYLLRPFRRSGLSGASTIDLGAEIIVASAPN